MNTTKFCEKNKINASNCEWVDKNPHMSDEKWQANHYKVTLTRRAGGKRYQLTVYFSMGLAHTAAPKADEVLDCLASDSASIENCRDFEDWAKDLGYDPDSRKAERIFKICEKQAQKLRAFLGDMYDKLLWDTDRL